MNIKLVQSGGLGGKKMTAVAASKLSAEEWNELIAVTKKKASNKRSPDAFHYTIQKDGDENSKAVIDISSIPEKHEGLFKKLFDKLTPEK